MLFSLILISIEKPGTKIKQTNAHFNFDLKWVNVTLLLHFFENHPNLNFEASRLLWLVFVRPGHKPILLVFSCEGSYIFTVQRIVQVPVPWAKISSCVLNSHGGIIDDKVP